MDFAPKRKRSVVYSSLLRLYPPTFQRQYSATMQQTLFDMLDSERTRNGRFLVWLRTVADVPFSAGKEHLTGGKDLRMNRFTKLIIVGAIIIVILIGLASFWEGNLHARNSLQVERVTSAQLADAMQQDGFYGTYGSAAVLFSAKVYSVQSQNNMMLVTFETGRPYNVVCQFGNTMKVNKGQIISVAAPAGSAIREPKGVLLQRCLMN